MSADLELHARKTAEAQLHDSDWLDGEPLDIGDGYSVAFHSPNCRYCLTKGLSLEEVLARYQKEKFVH